MQKPYVAQSINTNEPKRVRIVRHAPQNSETFPGGQAVSHAHMNYVLDRKKQFFTQRDRLGSKGSRTHTNQSLKYSRDSRLRPRFPTRAQLLSESPSESQNTLLTTVQMSSIPRHRHEDNSYSNLSASAMQLTQNRPAQLTFMAPPSQPLGVDLPPNTRDQHPPFETLGQAAGRGAQERRTLRTSQR